MMARINLEDQFWLEIMGVAIAMGNQDLAIGNAVRFFRYAQERHRHGKLVSEDDFHANGFSEALIPVYAKRVSGGIQCIGAEKHFGWLAQKIDAGRKGGRSKTEAKTKHLKQNQAKPSATEPSPSSSSSLSFSDSNSPSPISEISLKANANDFIVAYCDRFKGRWGENPHITGKDAGIAKRLGKTLSLAKFSHYLDAFFEMPDAWLVKIKHPLSAFESKLNEIVVFANTGQFTTNKQSQQADESVSNALLMQKVREGKA
jgi:hypothetical protein